LFDIKTYEYNQINILFVLRLCDINFHRFHGG